MSTPECPEQSRLMGTTELVDALAVALKVHRPFVRDVLMHLEVTVNEALRTGRRVRLPGIGILEARPVAARTGTSPARPGHPARAWSRPAGRRAALVPAATLTAVLNAARPDPSDGAADVQF